jgi:type IX secretion system PorP/SprF family membrane protein
MTIMVSWLFSVKGQDPVFSQYFSSPLNINPALTGNINGDWRVITNFRNQWNGVKSPFNTGTISFDSKLFQERFANATENGNQLSVGGMMMYDKAMSGIVNSNYASLNFSYKLKLYENYSQHFLGIGFGAIYGHRKIDFNKLQFENQYVNGYGFFANMPANEGNLSSMKPYFSTSTGLLYTISNEKSNFDLGVSAFHVNKPKQTFLKDENQILPIRLVAHANYERYMSENLVLNINSIFQTQSTSKYYSFGTAVGYIIPRSMPLVMVNAGMWYWSNNAIIPYLGFTFGNMQLGFSHDITVSKLNTNFTRPNTWEFSFILRGAKTPSLAPPCPWR